MDSTATVMTTGWTEIKKVCCRYDRIDINDGFPEMIDDADSITALLERDLDSIPLPETALEINGSRNNDSIESVQISAASEEEERLKSLQDQVERKRPLLQEVASIAPGLTVSKRQVQPSPKGVVPTMVQPVKQPIPPVSQPLAVPPMMKMMQPVFRPMMSAVPIHQPQIYRMMAPQQQAPPQPQNPAMKRLPHPYKTNPRSAYPERIRSNDNPLFVTSSSGSRNIFGDDVLASAQANGQVPAVKPSDASSMIARRTTPHVYRTPEQLRLAEQWSEVLIPVKIDIEHEGSRIRDVLTWNLNEPTLTPRKYAEIFCEDLNLPVHFVSLIAQKITAQLAEYRNLIQSGALLDHGYVPIELEIQLGKQFLRDKFMWDISPENTTTPEQFAETICEELGLSNEFRLLISHAIRDQIYRHLIDYSVVDDLGLNVNKKDIFTGSITTARRAVIKGRSAQHETSVPEVEVLDDEELEAIARAQERNARRMRRESRFARVVR